MWVGLAALFVRQIGHAMLEPPCHDKEAVLLGYNTRNKTLMVLGVSGDARRRTWRSRLLDGRGGIADGDRWRCSGSCGPVVVVFGRVAYLYWAHNLRLCDDLVRQARHRSHHRSAGLFPPLSQRL